jgi:hypothetical protein
MDLRQIMTHVIARFACTWRCFSPQYQRMPQQFHPYFPYRKLTFEQAIRLFYACCAASYVVVAGACLLTYNDLSMGRLSSVRL